MQFIVSSYNSNDNYQFKKFGDYFYWFDEKVIVQHFDDKIIFKYGVSWPVAIDAVDETLIEQQSGSWFYGILKTNSVTVYTDAWADFPIYFSFSNNEKIITTAFTAFDPNIFNVNIPWFLDALNLNLFQDRYITDTKINLVNILYKKQDLSTAIDQVYRMPHGSKLTITDNDYKLTHYYDKVAHYNHSLELPKLSNIQEYFCNKFDNNMQAILEQNNGKKLGVLSSTGVDSLTVVQYLLNRKLDFELASYCFSENKKLNEWNANIHQFHKYLESKNITVNFDHIKADEFFDRFLPNTWTVPSFFNDLYQETYTSKRYLENCDYLIKGTYGDECFLHTQRHAVILLGKTRDISFNQAVDQCRQHYSFQDKFFYVNENDYNKMQQFSLYDVIRDTWMLKPITYLSTDKVLLQKPVYSPYCDRDLSVITARMTDKELERSILDADQQRQYLNELRPFLNRYKSGDEEIQEHVFPVNQYSYDIYRYLINFAQTQGFIDKLSNKILKYATVKPGQCVDYDFIIIVQLATWLKNWLDTKLN